MVKNDNLFVAKTQKSDEFYTCMKDICAELVYYETHFRGKVVYMNCDDPASSNFWRYFHINFNRLGLKKIIATYYSQEAAADKTEYSGGDDNNLEAGIKTPLVQNGDFRSPECVELLKEADIVVTNPPFSLFREYVAQLMEYEKQFIIIGNLNAVTYRDVFPLIKDNKMWFGASIHSGSRKFYVPDDYPLNAIECGTEANGQRYIKVKGVRWYTNINYETHHIDLVTASYYIGREKFYPKYDNCDAINVDKTSLIPMDYDGVMGVPISFLDKYNPDQFEIVGFRKGEDGKDLVYTKDGRKVQPYIRILIRRRKT